MMPTRAMPERSPSQIRLGEWKSRNIQVLGAASGLAQQIAPHREEFGAHLLAQRRAAIGQIPFEHQPDLDQQRVGVEGGNRVG